MSSLSACYYIHDFKARINASGYSCTDNAVRFKIADKLYCSGGSIYFTDTALHQYDCIVLDCSFNVVKGTFGTFCLVSQLVCQLLLL